MMIPTKFSVQATDNGDVNLILASDEEEHQFLLKRDVSIVPAGQNIIEALTNALFEAGNPRQN